MDHRHFKRSSASVRLLLSFAHEHAVGSGPLLAGSGLSEEALADPHAELAADQELTVIANFLQHLERGASLGVEVGMRYHFSTYGLWGLGVISSRSGAEALAFALRFLPLTFALTQVTQRIEDNLVVLTYEAPDMPDAIRDFVIQRDMAAAALLLKETNGAAIALSRFSVSPSQPIPAATAAMLQKAFGVLPMTHGTANELAFEQEFLTRTPPKASEVTAAMCEEMCAQMLERRRLRDGTAFMVRQYLLARRPHLPDLATMARWLQCSERSLKRKLQLEGTTFTQLVNEVRNTQALELMANGSLTLTEVATSLGFSDLSTFSQAFKRWHGIAPSHYRSQEMHPW